MAYFWQNILLLSGVFAKIFCTFGLLPLVSSQYREIPQSQKSMMNIKLSGAIDNQDSESTITEEFYKKDRPASSEQFPQRLQHVNALPSLSLVELRVEREIGHSPDMDKTRHKPIVNGGFSQLSEDSLDPFNDLNVEPLEELGQQSFDHPRSSSFGDNLNNLEENDSSDDSNPRLLKNWSSEEISFSHHLSSSIMEETATDSAEPELSALKLPSYPKGNLQLPTRVADRWSSEKVKYSGVYNTFPFSKILTSPNPTVPIFHREKYTTPYTLTNHPHDRVKREVKSLTCSDYPSCIKACGSVTKHGATNSLYPCHCDHHCWLYGDCCPDYYDVCLQIDITASSIAILNSTLAKFNTYSKVLRFHDTVHWTQVSSCLVMAPEESSNYSQVVTKCSTESQILAKYHALHLELNSPSSQESTYFFGLPQTEINQRCEQSELKAENQHPLDHTHAILTTDPTVHFYNIFCAICNGVSPKHVTLWETEVTCDNSVNNDTDLSSMFSESISQVINNVTCTTENLNTRDYHIRPCFPYRSDCNSSQVLSTSSSRITTHTPNNSSTANSLVETNSGEDVLATGNLTENRTQMQTLNSYLCSRYQYPYEDLTTDTGYKNPHCQACGMKENLEMKTDQQQKSWDPFICHSGVCTCYKRHNDDLVMVFPVVVDPDPRSKGSSLNIPSFRILFDFRSHTTTMVVNTTVVTVETVACPENEVYVPYYEKCTPVQCVPGTHPVGGQCVLDDICNDNYTQQNTSSNDNSDELIPQLNSPCLQDSEPVIDENYVPFPARSQSVRLNILFDYILDDFKEDTSGNNSTHNKASNDNDNPSVTDESDESLPVIGYFNIGPDEKSTIPTDNSTVNHTTKLNNNSDQTAMKENNSDVFDDPDQESTDEPIYETVDEVMDTFLTLDNIRSMWVALMKSSTKVTKQEMANSLMKDVMQLLSSEVGRQLADVRVSQHILCVDGNPQNCQSSDYSWDVDKEDLVILNNRENSADESLGENLLSIQPTTLKPNIIRSDTMSKVTQKTDPHTEQISNPCRSQYSSTTTTNNNKETCVSFEVNFNSSEHLDVFISVIRSVVNDLINVAHDNNFELSRIAFTNNFTSQTVYQTTEFPDTSSSEVDEEVPARSDLLCKEGERLTSQTTNIQHTENGTYTVKSSQSYTPLAKFVFNMDLEINWLTTSAQVTQASTGWCTVDISQLQCPSGVTVNFLVQDFLIFENTLILTRMTEDLTEFLQNHEQKNNENVSVRELVDIFAKQFNDQSIVIFDKGSYVLTRAGATVCSNFSSSYERENITMTSEIVEYRLLPGSDVEKLASLVASVLSIACLAFTLAVYFINPTLRNVPGKIVMSLSGTLMLSQVLFLCSQLPKGTACQIYAAIHHAAWLASFAWLAIMSVDLAYILNFQSRSHSDVSRSNSFRIFMALGWGLPCILAIICFTLDQTHTVSIGYGQHEVCWLGNLKSMLIAFGAPVFVILGITFICAILVVYAIRQSSDFRRQNTSIHKKDRQQLILCFNLSLLMGLNWVFYFLAVSFDTDVLWVLHILVNGSQGLYILLCYVARKSILSKTMDRCSCWRSQKSRMAGQSQASPQNSGKTLTTGMTLTSSPVVIGKLQGDPSMAAKLMELLKESPKPASPNTTPTKAEVNKLEKGLFPSL